MSEPSEEHIRSPKQARSQQRVELILGVARGLIEAHGSANLSIADIAAEAGITPGSIYQYFPNRSAVIGELARRYLDELGNRMFRVLEPAPNDHRAAADRIDQLIELFFQMNLQDPVMRDIIQGLVADRALRDLNRDDTRAKVDLVCQALLPLVLPTRRDRFPLTVLLMVEFAESGVRAALDMPALEARQTIDRLKAMLRIIWMAEG